MKYVGVIIWQQWLQSEERFYKGFLVMHFIEKLKSPLTIPYVFVMSSTFPMGMAKNTSWSITKGINFKIVIIS